MSHAFVKITSLVSALAALTMATAPLCHAAASESRARVDVESKPTANGNLGLEFRLVPLGDMVINNDGPWKLELTKTDGVQFAATTYGKDKFKYESGSFLVESSAKPGAEKGEVGYKMIAFVCTKAKDKCFREVLQGTAPWTVAKK